MTKRQKASIMGLSLLFVLIFIGSFTFGTYPITPRELMQVIWGKLVGAPQTWSNQVELVIFQSRLPRLLGGALVGAALSTAGAAYQGVFRNPLVSPDLLGASSGAGFGAALALFLGLGYTWVSISAFVFGIAAVALACVCSIYIKETRGMGMVLAGVMISSLCTSATSFLKLVADPNDTLPAITYWLMGSLTNVTTEKIAMVAIPVTIGFVVLGLVSWQMNLLTMGEEEARAMGVNVTLVRGLVILAATLLTASCVSISGLIGWVGLVIPHGARLLVGYNYRVLLPTSALLGACFLMVVDNVARTVTTAQIPIGILTAFIGAPFFLLFYIYQGRKRAC